MNASLEERLRAHYADRTARERFDETPSLAKLLERDGKAPRPRHFGRWAVMAAAVVLVAGTAAAAVWPDDGGSTIDAVGGDGGTTVPVPTTPSTTKVAPVPLPSTTVTPQTTTAIPTTTTAPATTTIAPEPLSQICAAVEQRLVKTRGAGWEQVIGHLGNDPMTHPNWGGHVLDAPQASAPLVIYVVSDTAESIQAYSVNPDGSVDGPTVVDRITSDEPPQADIDLTRGYSIEAGQTGIGVYAGAHNSSQAPRCDYRFDGRTQ